MRIFLTKSSDERHALEIEREDGRRERVELETRSCLLHDLTHFAVEEDAGLEEGFFGALAAGRTLAELADPAQSTRPYTDVMLEVERAVAVLQNMPRSGEEPAALHARIVAMLAIQGGAPPPWFTVELVTRVHERMRRLFGQWKATPYRSSMELYWSGGRVDRSIT